MTALLCVLVVVLGIIPFFYNAIHAGTVSWMRAFLPL